MNAADIRQIEQHVQRIDEMRRQLEDAYSNTNAASYQEAADWLLSGENNVQADDALAMRRLAKQADGN